MVITSLRFFIFVAITLSVYYFFVPKKYQWCVLLAASYVFYALTSLTLIVFIISATLTVFFGAIGLKKVKKPVLIVFAIVLLNIGVLAFFKWWNTIANAGNNLFSAHTGNTFRLPLNSLLLPLGISFYTFQAVGYLVDVYREQIEPERNVARFALFISFFPQLIQGPISRHSEIAEQLYASRKINSTEMLHGFQLLLWGLFKKLVVADRLAIITAGIFAAEEVYNGLYITFGTVAYTIWLYMDFSGGVDIARGIGQMFGIIMPQNFLRPFFAVSLPDFWRRFHISLNNWWRDYLFYPIVLSKPMTKLGLFIRKKISPGAGRVTGIYITVIIVRLVNALWLGAGLFYVANGLYYGIIIVIAMILEPLFTKIIKMLHINTKNFFWKLFQIIRTFILNCIGHMFLATSGAALTLYTLSGIAGGFKSWGFDPRVSFPALSSIDRLVMAASLLLILIMEILQERGYEIRKTLGQRNIVIQGAILMIGLWVIIIFGHYGFDYDSSTFAYMGF